MTILRQMHFFGVLAVLLFATDLSFAADDKADKKAGNKPVMVVMDVFPYGWREGREEKGLFVEIAELVREKSGINYRIVLQPFGRVIKSLETGKADFSIFYSYPDTISGYENLGNVSCSRLIAVPMAGSGIQKLEDMEGKSVLFPPGGYFDRHYARKLKVKPIPVTAAESILELAFRGRADAFIASDQLLDAYQMKISSRHLMPDEFWPLLDKPINLVEANIAFVLSGKSGFADHSAKISAVIRDLQRSGELDRISRKYTRNVSSVCFSGLTQQPSD